MKLYCDFTETSSRYTGQQLGKKANLYTIFRLIMQSEGISRVQLANITKLTKTTVSALVDLLCERGYVVELGIGRSDTSGRKPIILDINPKGAMFPVVALTRTGVELTVYDLKLNVIERKFRAFPVKMPDVSETEQQYMEPNIFSSTILELLNRDAESIQWDRVPAIGYSYLGTMHWDTGRFSCTPLRIRTSMDYIQNIFEGVGKKPIFVENATINIAYGAMAKNMSDTKDFVFINIGEGVGVGRIERSEDNNEVKIDMIELGHVSVDINGRKCSCGNRGCVERYITCKTIISDIVKRIEHGEQSVLMDLCGGKLENASLATIRKAAEMGDELVRDEYRHVARYLAAAINSMICIIKTKGIVLGGGIEHLGDIFLEDVRKSLMEHSMKSLSTKVNISYIENSDDLESMGIVRQYIETMLLEDLCKQSELLQQRASYRFRA